ncbi:kelch-like protein 9 isoform X2 [Protopterus annectens]|uniref:kelch-like protein 9 isoform X2 n=1 Tax=Protopterus annectens TaxID=7888 RepID=UPI001CFA1D26|nr:kelch-like protein 9 isoform X2 [Protopterus annectens]
MDDNKRHVCCQQFPQALQKGFQELWEDRTLCDVELCAENETFAAHRSVLAAASHYFRIMFTADMLERSMQSVALKGISAVGLKTALHFIYTSRFSCEWEHLEDVLLTSTHLQIPLLTDSCDKLMQKSLKSDNFSDMLSFADRYSLPKLKVETFSFISHNLDQLLAEQESALLQLDFESVLEILGRNDITSNVNEGRILDFAVKWLTFDLDNRLCHLDKLIKEVRLGLLCSPECYNGNCEALDILRSVPGAEKYIKELGDFCLKFNFDSPYKNWLQIRSTQKGVLAVCGKTAGSQECREIMVFTGEEVFRQDSWRPITQTEGTYNHCAVVLNDYLYVIGGQNSWFNHNHEDEATATVRRYDPRFDRWIRLTNMQVRRRRFHCSVLGSSIYAVGGRGEGGILCSTERYDPSEDKWEYVRALPCPLSSHAGAVCQNKLFVSGGVIITGVEGQRRTYSDVKVTECYCPVTDQWTELTHLPVGHSQHGAAALGNKIYIIGGFSWNEEGFLKNVHAYDTESDSWSAGPELPRPLVGLSSGVLTLPYYLSKKNDVLEPL